MSCDVFSAGVALILLGRKTVRQGPLGKEYYQATERIAKGRVFCQIAVGWVVGYCSSSMPVCLRNLPRPVTVN